MESWTIAFSISFLINFGIVYIWFIYQSLDKKVWFTILFFLSQREFSYHPVRNIDFFLLNYDLFCSKWSYEGQITKMYINYFIGKCDHTIFSCFIKFFLYDPAYKAWVFENSIFELEAFYSFKITCVLVMQVISFNKK